MSISDDWSTPADVYEAICKHWKLQPTLDVCASSDNALTINYITKDQDALTRAWGDLIPIPIAGRITLGAQLSTPVCWMNPPYSQPIMTKFIEKAIAESKRGATVLFLLPAWVDQPWYHDLIKQYPHEFWRGRIKFDPPPGVKPSSPRNGNIHGVIREPLDDWEGLR